MQLLHRIEDFVDPKKPIFLTIGNFDGLHRGHAVVLKRLRERVGSEGHALVMTFSNHPSEVLRPENPTPFLCTLDHKIQLIEAFNVNTLLILPFTRYLALHSAASFIEKIRMSIPFSCLILGHDATLGKDRQGDRRTLNYLGVQWGFNVEYLEEYRYEGQPVSSSKIRELIQQGQLERAEELLGRPYSIYSTVIPGEGKGKQMGFPTANLNVQGLCLPPLGVYAVSIKKDGNFYQGIANLGAAPTVRNNAKPLLEVHIFNESDDLYGQSIEVIFRRFIRLERKFQSIDELKKQIQIDIEMAK